MSFDTLESLASMCTFASHFYKNNAPQLMGKGDFKSKRGKIRRGTNGKSRPNPRKMRAAKKTAA